jgi:hypothetical protein
MLLDRGGALPLLKKRDVLFPGDTHQDVQTMARGGIQEPARRHRVGAYRVQSMRRHAGKILLDHRGVILMTLRIRAEGSIRHATKRKFRISKKDELATHLRADTERTRRRW